MDVATKATLTAVRSWLSAHSASRPLRANGWTAARLKQLVLLSTVI